MSKASDALAEVKARFGISLREVGTGGGCIAYEARLESGHWIVVTNEALGSLEEQEGWEADNAEYYGPDSTGMGVYVGFYNHLSDELDWSGADCIHMHIEYDCAVDAIPFAVDQALAEFANILRRPTTY